MELLLDYHLWVSFLTLTALEVVLGIDNVVFIALLVGHLPEEQRERTRVIGLLLALVMRIALLFGVAWIISLQEPWFTLFDHSFSGKDILLFFGGSFLIYKGTSSIHDEVTGDAVNEYKAASGGVFSVLVQVVVIDLVFSFDSVMTAIGITHSIMIIVAAMSVAMLAMIFLSGMIAGFVEKYPTLKMLALSFIMLIGVFLVAEAFHVSVPKGYIYFAMAFSFVVEMLNLVTRKRRLKRLEAVRQAEDSK